MSIATHSLADYHEIKLSVMSITATDFKHQIGCYCYTPGIDKSVEPAPLYKKVNFYRFKAWIIDRDWIVNFDNWLFKYRNTAHFYICLADYINAEENRTKVYIQPTALDSKIADLLAKAQDVTNIFHSLK